MRRLISAPVVEPESVAETVASSHSPLALHRGFRTHRLSLASAQRSAPSRRLISICQRSPKAGLAIATYWPSGEDWDARSRTPRFAGEVEAVNDVLYSRPGTV